MRKICIALCLLIVAHAQQTGLRFEVTSVKLNTLRPQSRLPEFGCNGSQFVSRSHNIDLAIRYAFQIEFFQLGALPKWAEEEIYDMEGRANSDLTEAQCREMVRGLLADRFKLAIRRESREVPVLALMIDKGGPKMRRAGTEDGPNGPEFVINGKPMQMFDRQLKGLTMPQLVQALGIAQLGLPILDKTGLEGQYRISLTFDQVGTSDAKAPEVTTALREQLGLRLESQRGTIEFFTFANLERPDPN